MIYGEPQFKIEADVTDRIGIRTLIQSKLWQASRWPLSDAELQDEKPAPPTVAGGMLFIGDETRPVPGALRTYWTFEGINGDGRTVTFKDRSASLDYGFQPGLEQVDIRKHPKIQELMERYGGIIDPSSLDIIWPLTVPASASSGMKKSAEEGERNPMFGRNEYLDATGTYTFRYASFNPPSQAGIGRIHKSGLPGKPPGFADRDWLQAPSPFVRRGVVFDITEMYLLSGPGGWPEPIHNLARSNTTAVDGLSTGTL